VLETRRASLVRTTRVAVKGRVMDVARLTLVLGAVVALIGCGGPTVSPVSLWQRLPHAGPPDTDGSTLHVAFTGPERGWSSRYMGVGVYRTSDGGRLWSVCRGAIVRSPRLIGAALPRRIRDLHNVVSVVSAGGTVFALYDGRAPHVGPTQKGVHAGVVASSDSGRTWRVRLQLPRLRDYVLEMSAPDREHLWVLTGDDPVTTRRQHLLSTSDGGRSWREVWRGDSFADPAHSLETVQFVSDTTGWAVDDQAGEVVRTTNGGRTWQRAGTSYGILFALDASHAWQCTGEYEEDGGGYGGLYATSDAGSSWRALPGFEKSAVWAVYFATAERGWIVSAGILGTVDGGRRWTVETSVSGLSDADNSLFVPAGDRLYMGSGDVLLMRRLGAQ
jgi:photosystem II stability/assembly factor-like uncharacterized protein